MEKIINFGEYLSDTFFDMELDYFKEKYLDLNYSGKLMIADDEDDYIYKIAAIKNKASEIIICVYISDEDRIAIYKIFKKEDELFISEIKKDKQKYLEKFLKQIAYQKMKENQWKGGIP